MIPIEENLARVRQRIRAACTRAGRSDTEVDLIAVSKRQPVEAIRAAYAAGQIHFGENYAQELRDKAAELSELGTLRWHAIGALQPNKAKYVSKSAHVFHALDRIDVAAELAKRREGEPLACYLEVNLAEEARKGGVAPTRVEEVLTGVRRFTQLQLVGLMCLPPLQDTAEAARPYFKALRSLAQRFGLSGLSMGTSHDFEIAIEEGATAVRVGEAIFGKRPPRQAAGD